MSSRWLARLVLRLVAPRYVMAPDGASDDMVVQDALQVRRRLNALSKSRAAVALQGIDGRHFGSGLLRTNVGLGVAMVMQEVESKLPIEPPTSLNAIASGEGGLMSFTLHGLTAMDKSLLHAPWPDTLIQIQSRRHFRVSGRAAGLSITLSGSQTRVPLRDLSEEGVGLLLDHGDWPLPEGTHPVQLHLGDLTLPVPMLHRVHGGPGVWVGAGRLAGARLVGMTAEHLAQLRDWLSACQGAGAAPPGAQA